MLQYHDHWNNLETYSQLGKDWPINYINGSVVYDTTDVDNDFATAQNDVRAKNYETDGKGINTGSGIGGLVTLRITVVILVRLNAE